MRRHIAGLLLLWVLLSGTGFAQPASHDSLLNGLAKGALVGAGAVVAIANFRVKDQNCGLGCGFDLHPVEVLILLGEFGGLGGLVGMAIDRDADGWPGTANRHFAARPAIRLGPDYTHLTVHSNAVRGRTSTAGLDMAIQMSPHVSGHVEYTVVRHRFLPPPGSVPASILQNVVPEESQTQSRSYGIESREIRYQAAALMGLTPRPWGRVRVGVLAGVGVQSGVSRDYYDAVRWSGPLTDRRVERLPGRYSVHDVGTATMGWVVGLDTEIAVAKRLSLVPKVRVNAFGRAGASVGLGAGAHWRF